MVKKNITRNVRYGIYTSEYATVKVINGRCLFHQVPFNQVSKFDAGEFILLYNPLYNAIVTLIEGRHFFNNRFLHCSTTYNGSTVHKSYQIHNHLLASLKYFWH